MSLIKSRLSENGIVLRANPQHYGGVTDRLSGYNSTFWYPKAGGIGRLVQGLRAGISNCIVNRDVTAVSLRDKSICTGDHQTLSWDVILSSIPLKSLCEMTNDDELISASSLLSHSSTVSFNIGMRCRLRPEFQGVHWVYVPDRAIPFYRIGFYSNISVGMCSPGHSAVYVEVGLPAENVDQINVVQDLQPKVLGALEQLGWVDSRDVVCVVTHVMRHAYVHHTPRSETARAIILKRLRESGIFPIGRYGLWDYTSMEDSMESARVTALEVN